MSNHSKRHKIEPGADERSRDVEVVHEVVEQRTELDQLLRPELVEVLHEVGGGVFLAAPAVNFVDLEFRQPLSAVRRGENTPVNAEPEL